MKIDRAAFFAAVRASFGTLNQAKVDGFNAILKAWEERYTARTPLTQLAYCLATPWLETAGTMQPIREYGNTAYFTKLYDVRGKNPVRARKMGNTQPGDGAKFRGRGLVQLTWKANYEKATKVLQALGVLKADESLVKDPELACRPDVAVALLFEGMEQGWFTGVTLDKTIDAHDDEGDGDEFADFVKARRIINGTDKAEKIAGFALKFLEALIVAVRHEDSVRPAPVPAPEPIVVPTPAPIVVSLPQSAPAPAEKPKGFLAALAALFRPASA
jgi:hypothetical protein